MKIRSRLNARMISTLAALCLVLTMAGVSTFVAPVPSSALGLTSAQDEQAPADDTSSKKDRKKDRKSDTAATDDSADATPAPNAPRTDQPQEPDAGDGETDLDCIDFDTQEEAQAILDEDPADPFDLDPNGDGIACALLRSAADLAADQTPDEGASSGRRNRNQQEAEAVELTCDTLSQEEAQAELDLGTGDPAILDPDGDGVACESEELGQEPAEEPAAKDRKKKKDRNKEEVPVEEPANQSGRDTTADAPPEDIDCKDFQFQEEAQAVYDSDPLDPYNLDPNGDGFACSSLPMAAPSISAIPATGAGTGAGIASLTALASVLAGAGAMSRRFWPSR